MWNVVIHKLVLIEDFKKIDLSSRRLILKSIYKKLTKDPELDPDPEQHTAIKHVPVISNRLVLKTVCSSIRLKGNVL